MYVEGDIPTITTTNGCNNGYGGFGNNGDWVLIILFALIFGNNWGGFGGFGNGAGGVAQNYVLGSDSAFISRQIDSARASTEMKLDSISNGICSLGYDQLAQMNGINSNIMQNGYETRLAVNGVGTQLAQCCCDLRAGQADIKYGMAMNTNALQNSMCLNTRDIIDNQNANFRAIHDELVANRIEDKNAQIQAQQNEINALRLKASQEAQNNYLVDQLKPCPKPSYFVPNPNCCYGNYVFPFGYNNGCSGTNIQ